MFENFCANHVINTLVADYAECCEKLEGNRSIKLETKHIQNQLLFMVKNSFDGNIQHKADSLRCPPCT